MKIFKRHNCCKTCGHLTYGHKFVTVIDWSCFCEINEKRIEYPREMGGRDKCHCYMTKAEYRKAVKKKTINKNHVYPQKSDEKAIW